MLLEFPHEYITMKNLLATGAFLLLSLISSVSGQAISRIEEKPKLFLQKSWSIQSSAKVQEKGDAISRNTFQPRGWYAAKVPSTIVGTLVENQVFPEPFLGMNLRQMPGCTYPIGANFSNLPMPEDSPFRVSWWYRTQFRLPPHERGRNLWLHFEGINFRANIWLNGQLLAAADEIAGTFRIHKLNITRRARPGELNSLAVEVFAAQPDDLGWTWVDWNPMPPDKNMGIFRPVYITSSGPVTVEYPQVVSHLDQPSLAVAHLTINAEVSNSTEKEIEGILQGKIEEIRFSQKIKLRAGETKSVQFTSERFPQLNISRPRLWWPLHMGLPNLYPFELSFITGGKVSDSRNTRFGIREVTSHLDGQNHRVFQINGKNILIRGGGWATDMFLRHLPERLRAELQYVKDMNLNAIRLEGQLESEYFFELADEQGILIMPGWCCCSHWEHWQHRPDYPEGPTWDKEDYAIAAKSQADQIRRLRNHPSVFVWLNGSDNPPPADVEQMYVDILKQHQWPNPFLSSATAKVAPVTGPTGVKMEGPYEWVPPSYWLLDKKLGGAHGFATEISPGPAVPPVASLQQMLPKDHWWPIDEYWNYHAGGGQFKDLKVFTEALETRYGPAAGVEDYSRKAQLMSYEGQRAMFEAFGGNRYTSTGVIQWMLNNAWPSMIWHLYDYYLRPGGGYFGTKKACEPVHVQYSYADKSVLAVNTTLQAFKNLKLTIRVFDINLAEKFTHEIALDLPADTNSKPFVLPDIRDLSATYFLKLSLTGSDGKELSSNFYWLSTKDDVLDFEKSTWYYTPTSSLADMRQLQELPRVKLAVSGITKRKGEEETAHVTLTNHSKHLGFFVHLQLQGERSGREVLPILWQDNYFSLLPGERRVITGTYNIRDLENDSPKLVVEGWNVEPVSIPLRGAVRASGRERLR